tara:strand:+ start:386 stop:2440 length:2055 start_codon:yes stop_codon:yes gene_type:complete
MTLFLQISGFVYLVVSYCFSLTFNKTIPRHFNLLIIYVALYIEFTMLSIFKILNVYSLSIICVVKIFYLLKKRFNFRSVIKPLSKTDLIIAIVYAPVFTLTQLTGFNFDDTITTYLPRVQQWVQEESIFITLNLSEYYIPMLIYPQASQFPLLLIEIFKLPYLTFVVFSLFATSQILLTIQNFFNFNKNESDFLKFLLFLSPIVIILSTSGLTDLFYSYFLVNSFFLILNFFKNKDNETLLYSFLFTIFSINIRYHGFFILFVIGVLILKNRDFKIYLKSTTYTILLTLAFIFPSAFWIYHKKIYLSFYETFNTQYNSLSGAYQQNIDINLINNAMNNLPSLSKMIVNIYTSIAHTLVNFTYSDFPLIFLISDSNSSFNQFLINFNVYLKSYQVRTVGTVLFLISIFAILNLFVEGFSLNSRSRTSKFKILFFILALILIVFILILENFFLGLTLLFVLGFSLIILNMNKFDYEKLKFNHKDALLIFSLYFLLISIRNFNDTNLRYLFPIFVFIFPFGVKIINHFLQKKLKRIFIYLIVFVSSMQSIFLSDMLFSSNLPDIKMYSSDENKMTGGWNPIEERQNINKTINIYEKIIDKNPNFNSIISLQNKFPLSIFKNDLYYEIFEEQYTVNEETFLLNNSNILITDNKNLLFDKNLVTYLDSGENIEEKLDNNYFIIFYKNNY